MPKIRIIATNEIVEKPQAWINYFVRQIDIVWELVEDSPKNSGAKITGAEDSKEKAFDKLTEGEKDSCRKGFKELVLRKAGWILRDTVAKCMNEIHISIPDRSSQIAAAKDSAIERAKKQVELLTSFKEILKQTIRGEQLYVSFEAEDLEELEKMIDSLSIGVNEVEVLKSENAKLAKRLGAAAGGK